MAASGGGSGRKKRKPKRGRAQSPLAGDLRTPLEGLHETVSQLSRQLKDAGPSSEVQLLLPSSFFPCCQQASQLLSDACTKLAVLFSRPPLPSSADCTTVTSRVEQAATHLLATYYQLSPVHGKTLHQEVEKSVRCIFQAVVQLTTAILDSGSSTASEGLQGTGTVWEHCDAMARLSKDNKAAVVKVLISQLHLLRDASGEVEELESERGRGEEGDWGCGEGSVDTLTEGVSDVALNGGDRNEQEEEEDGGKPREWTERELQLVKPCVELVKMCSEAGADVCRAVVSSGRSEAEKEVSELDQTAETLQQLSPLADDLVEELPAPLDWGSCKEAGAQLGDALMHLLHTVSSSHFGQVAGDKWNSKKYTDSVSALMERIKVTQKPQSFSSS